MSGPKKPCAWAGCRVLLPLGVVYCAPHQEAHDRARWARADRARAGVAWRRWYKTAAWRNRRRAHLQAHPDCVECRRAGRIVPATELDHVIPHRGNAHLFFHGEVQGLCAAHHARKQRQEGGV